MAATSKILQILLYRPTKITKSEGSGVLATFVKLVEFTPKFKLILVWHLYSLGNEVYHFLLTCEMWIVTPILSNPPF